MINKNKKAKLLAHCYSYNITNNTITKSNKEENITISSDTVSTKSKSSPKQIKNNSNENHYKFELYTYGHLADTLECYDRKTAIKYFYSCDSSFDFGFKLYINNKLVEYKDIKNKLKITNIDYMNYCFKNGKET